MSSSSNDIQSLYLRATVLGTLAGMRSLSPLALVAHEASNHPKKLRDTPLSPLTSSSLAEVLKYGAFGEIIGDKMPFLPDRTALPLLAWRTASGAVSGAAVFMSQKQSPVGGAAAGGVAAIASSYLFRNLRVGANKKLHIPGLIAGLLEDAVVLALVRTVSNL